MENDFYKKIIKQSPVGYAYFKILVDSAGKPIDYELLEANTVFEKLTGTKSADHLNKKISEIYPGRRSGEIDWITYYGEIALSGIEKEYEHYSEPLKRWFKVQVYSPEKYYFITLFSDITEHKLLETIKSELNKKFIEINTYSLELAYLPYQDIFPYIVKNIKKIFGVKAAWITAYDQETSDLVIQYSSLNEKENSRLIALVGKKIKGLRTHISEKQYKEITSENFRKMSSFNELTFGAVPNIIGKVVEKILGIEWFIGIALMHEDKLIGTLIIVGHSKQPAPEKEAFLAFSGITANALGRKAAEEVLGESEERFEEIFNSTHEAIFIHDSLTGKILDTNDRVLKMYGYSSKKELLNSSIGTISANQLQFTEEKAQENIRKSFKGEPHTFNWLAKKKNGETFWVEVSLKSSIIGGKDRVLAVVRDISERKQAEDALREREEFAQKKSRILAELVINPDMNSGNLQAAKGILSKKVAHLLNVARTSIWLLSDAGRELRCIELYETGTDTHSEGMILHAADYPIYFEALRVKSRITAHDARVDPLICEFRDHYLIPLGITSMLDAVISGDNCILGVVCLEHIGEPRKWHYEEESLVTIFATLTERVIEIYQRKQVESSITRNLKFTEALMKSIPAPVFFKDIQGRYLGCNEMFSRVMGVTSDEIMDKTVMDLFPSDHAEIYHQKDLQLLSNPGHQVYESKVTTKSGQILDVLFTKDVFYDETGQIAGIVGAFIDITDRKMAEEELANTKVLLHAAFEQSPIPMALATVPDYSFKIINKAAEDFLLIKASDYLNKTPSEIKITWQEYSPEGRKITVPELPMPLSLNGISTKNMEMVVERCDGSKVWQLASGAPIYGTNGKLIAGLLIMLDITQRKHIEQALASEKERLAVTLRSIGDGVITTDTEGNIIIMNRVAEELTGWKQNEALCKPLSSVFNIINEITREQCENPVEKVLASGSILELANHTLLISRDGTERIIADSGAPIRDKDSAIIGVVLVFRDMTEKQKLIENAQRTDKLDSLGVLAGGIAHDFNNLLVGVFGYIDLARLKSKNDAFVSTYLDKALSVFNRAKDLTQQLLTFSQGGAPIRKTGTLELVITNSASFALSGSNIACEYQLAQDLWLCDFDENQIGQVIDNMVLNAQQVMPHGGKIVIQAENILISKSINSSIKEGNYIKISISDTGTGIPPDMLKRIFDPFFTTKQKGSGLGLATCYSIIHKHGGSIEVESVLGKGTTFKIFLPASKQKSVQTLSPSAVHHIGHGRILVMDDEAFIREIIGELLVLMGYTVIEAKDGEEALQKCEEALELGELIDCAILDITIPGGMGGKETIVKMRKKYPDMIIFASSGYSENPVMSKPTEYGFSGSIRKPYSPDELAETLNRYMR